MSPEAYFIILGVCFFIVWAFGMSIRMHQREKTEKENQRLMEARRQKLEAMRIARKNRYHTYHAKER